MNPDLLIGHSGTVGSTLLRQRTFDEAVRKADLHTVQGRHFGTVICAGAPGVKWLANRDPQADQDSLALLRDTLGTLTCKQMVLISTVDVYRQADGQTEQHAPLEGTSPYGAHRLDLERFVTATFPGALIVRLPGLVGPGLRKNALYDLLHGQTEALDPRAAFQFYPLVNLWNDVRTLLEAGIHLAHLSTEPLSLGWIAREAFGVELQRGAVPEHSTPARYDLHSSLAHLWGKQGPYLYSARESMTAIRAYAQSGGAYRDAPQRETA